MPANYSIFVPPNVADTLDDEYIPANASPVLEPIILLIRTNGTLTDPVGNASGVTVYPLHNGVLGSATYTVTRVNTGYYVVAINYTPDSPTLGDQFDIYISVQVAVGYVAKWYHTSYGSPSNGGGGGVSITTETEVIQSNS